MKDFFCKMNWHLKLRLIDQHYHLEETGGVQKITSSETRCCSICGFTKVHESESTVTITPSLERRTITEAIESRT